MPAPRNPAPRQSTPRPPAPRLANQTWSGMVWLLAETGGGKLIAIGTQLALAWLLAKDDFGLVALAYTVTTFIGLVSNPGLKVVLVQRQNLRRWANPAFWMSMTAGAVGSLLIVAAAWPTAWAYGQPELVLLMLVLACSPPLTNLSLVPEARLQAELRFRTISAVGVGRTAVQSALAVGFAAAGLGPLSFVLPLPITAAAKAVVLWRLAPTPVRRRPQLRRWRFLFGHTSLLLASGLLITVTGQADRMLLGLWHDPAVVGVYFMAFQLSIQTVMLFTQSLTKVLFPVLSRMRDEAARQSASFLRAARVLAAVAMPLCAAQAAVADPVLRLALDPKWEPAIPVLQWLSVGMAFRAVGSPAASLMQAQGRFRGLLGLSGGYAALYLGLVAVGAGFGAATETAACVALYFLLAATTNVRVALAGVPGATGATARVFGPPAVVGALALAASWAVQHAVAAPGASVLGDLARLGAGAGAFVATWGAAAAVLSRAEYGELWQRVAPRLRRGGG